MASYRAAIRWIAENDESATTDHETVSLQVTVCLVADLWHKLTDTVASDVLAERKSPRPSARRP